MKHLVIFGYVKDKTYICKILNAFITSIYLLLKILTTEKNMKKTMVALMVASACASFAQVNVTVKDGKRWNQSYYIHRDQSWYPYEEYLSGETVIDGRRCLNLYQTFEQKGMKDVLIGALYEKDHKVYLYQDNTWSLLYDFTLNVGDTTNVGTGDSSYGYGAVKVWAVDTIEVNGTHYRRMSMIGNDEETKNESKYPDWVPKVKYWIEGIGCERGLLESSNWWIPSSYGYRLDQCVDGDSVIFTAEDFYREPVTDGANNDGACLSMLSDGKHWKSLYSRGMLVTGAPYEEYLAGERVEDGHKCLRYYVTCDGDGVKDRFGGLVYEEDRKVYIKRENSGNWQLLYDFSLQPGDTAAVYDGTVKVIEVDTVEVSGVLRCRMKMTDWLPGHSEEMSREGYWIEGVGSDRGFLQCCGWNLVGAVYALQQCVENNSVIFTAEDFAREPVTASARTPLAVDDANAGVYSLDGQLVARGKDASSLPAGLYIVRTTDGRARKVFIKQ